MFKKLTIEERLRKEQEKNKQLLNERIILEDALLETTTLLANGEMKNMQNEQAIIELSMLLAGGGAE